MHTRCYTIIPLLRRRRTARAKLSRAHLSRRRTNYSTMGFRIRIYSHARRRRQLATARFYLNLTTATAIATFIDIIFNIIGRYDARARRCRLVIFNFIIIIPLPSPLGLSLAKQDLFGKNCAFSAATTVQHFELLHIQCITRVYLHRTFTVAMGRFFTIQTPIYISMSIIAVDATLLQFDYLEKRMCIQNYKFKSVSPFLHERTTAQYPDAAASGTK